MQKKMRLYKKRVDSNSKKIQDLNKKITGFENKIKKLKTIEASLINTFNEIKRKIQEIEGQLQGEPLEGPAQPAQEGLLNTSGGLNPGGASSAGTSGNLTGGAEEEAGGNSNPNGSGSAGAGRDSSEGGAVVEGEWWFKPRWRRGRIG